MAAPNQGDDFRRVYEAVAAGESAERLRALIDECAQGDDERRKAAVDQAGEHDGYEETPLDAADFLHRGDLIGVLLEAGAEPGEFDSGGRATALSVAIQYGLVDTVRFLLKAGHDLNERVYFGPGAPPSGDFKTAVHFCILPPCAILLSGQPPPRPPPRLDCLEILVREGGADVDARDSYGQTAMHEAARATADRIPALDLLVSLGADVNTRNDTGTTLIFDFALHGDLESLRRLLGHGASPDVFDDNKRTPLMWACWSISPSCRRDVAFELARRSSPETIRAVATNGWSAADELVSSRSSEELSTEPWRLQLLGVLLSAGARMMPHNAARLLPIAAAHAQRQRAELAARRSAARRWRAHDAFVGLSLDKQEEREAEGLVAAKRRRLAELERQVQANEGGVDGDEDESDSDSESVSESESDSDSESESSGGSGDEAE